ncbi:hypothetical protein TNCV_11721 [Trichonephila clavipes]|nr:hypothetical protein TNCV_11721 [Trichonephila clavipes]
MHPLEDTGKNGWIMADFTVMIVAVTIGPTDQENALIVRSAVTVPDSLLSNLRRTRQESSPWTFTDG